jgi:SMODS-associating 2TM, beta-strand rich effector domain
MTSLTLNYSELLLLLRVFAIASVAIASLLAVPHSILLQTNLVTTWVKYLGVGITISTLLLGLVARRAWTSPRLERWLGRQRVHGLWWGTLDTDYGKREGKVMDPIAIAFVIRQTYLTVSIQSYTSTQPARSTMENLHHDVKTTDTQMSYVFEMKRNGENKLTVGFGQLDVIDGGSKLDGYYWTNSPTQGRLRLRLVRRDCQKINSFEAAEKAAKDAGLVAHSRGVGQRSV